jgi:hypothetical protein
MLTAEMTTMIANIDVRITSLGRATANLAPVTRQADAAVWREAAEVLRERIYATARGVVRVRADWSTLLEREEVQLVVHVFDEREAADTRDAASFAELYLHDVFLLMNVAVPGSLSAALSVNGGIPFGLDARMFEYAWVTASRNGASRIAPLLLADVVAWYDALGIGTQQMAPTAIATALFHLLHLARGDEDDVLTILRLAQAAEALELHGAAVRKLYALRDSIVHGTAPVMHPMHDDALDPRVDHDTLDVTDAVDLAASAIVSALQEQIQS